ncbi:L-allo-threonine dehydrogenase [Amedibacterium intestinale]|uniref:L-allo-threonine dehydrogenase n=1 Tax=Amedibacterium intestinale TaxID=2583452 RepID=A0A6N4TJ08_9FIRM|nr:SDR family NAD(P)-dependent oxidoreductase [Amedibacterium intestinale]BBK22828.1 L-allo-threonine dehydrogenase [Amedibacterium intestinale]
MKNRALISGATGGIGTAICEMLVEMNYDLILLGKNQEKLSKLYYHLKKLNSEVSIVTYTIDFYNLSLLEKNMRNISEKYNDINLLINNAGIGYFSLVKDITIHNIEKSLNINFISTAIITKCILKNMLQHLESNNQIINISSIAGTKSFKQGSIYSSTKFAMEGFTQALWEEIKSYGIKVCLIRPGLVNTGLFRNKENFENICKALQPKDIANCIKFILQQSEYSNINEISIRPIKKEAQNLFYEIIKGDSL